MAKHPCPTCKQLTSLKAENAHRPFCSKRCKDGDFIEWGNEENRIAGMPDIDELMSGDLEKLLKQ